MKVPNESYPSLESVTFRQTQVRCRRPNRLVHELTQTKSNTSIKETSGGNDIFMLSLLRTLLIIGNKPEPWHSHCAYTTDTILHRYYSVVCDCWNQQWVSWCWDWYCCSQSYMSFKFFIWRWFRGGTFFNRVIKTKDTSIMVHHNMELHEKLKILCTVCTIGLYSSILILLLDCVSYRYFLVGTHFTLVFYCNCIKITLSCRGPLHRVVHR